MFFALHRNVRFLQRFTDNLYRYDFKILPSNFFYQEGALATEAILSIQQVEQNTLQGVQLLYLDGELL